MPVLTTKQAFVLSALNMKAFALFILSFVFIQLALAQTDRYISLTQKIEVLENHKKITNFLDLYFDKEKSTLTKHLFKPHELITMANSLGEMKIYYPESNEVAYKQSPEYSSLRNIVYYFSNNNTDHLGLVDEGFNLVSQNYENSYLVTVWKSPDNLNLIDRVKMVFEGANPIYAEYTDKKGAILKRIYYSSYSNFSTFRLPLRITEINYQPTGDSIVNRSLFSKVRVTSTPESDFFNFKIPDDAIPLQPK